MLFRSVSQSRYIGGNNENIKIKLRDGFDPNPEPLIVINGYIVENKEILRRFRFVETIEIRCLKKDDLKFIYGTRALNGVIVISLSKKRFKQDKITLILSDNLGLDATI